MANITQKEEGSESHHRGGQRPIWNPFGIFSGLPGWVDPFGALLPAVSTRTFNPAFDARETKDAYVFEADLPGIKEDELEISVSGKRLTISGKRESEHHEQNERYSFSERAYGSFQRNFTLSDDAEPEGVNAEFRDGVLQISVPKREEPQARRVPLHSEQRSGGGQQEKVAGARAQLRGQAQERAQERASSGGQKPSGFGHRRRAAQRLRKGKS
jgi:HSP20 family protein